MSKSESNDFSQEEERRIYERYAALIEASKQEEKAYYQTYTLETKKRHSKAFNFLKRLSRYEDVLRFFEERKVKLFTNNAVERDKDKE